MRALSGLNVWSQWKLNLHAVLLRFINLLHFGEQILSFHCEDAAWVKALLQLCLHVCSEGRLTAILMLRVWSFKTRTWQKLTNQQRDKSSLTFHPNYLLMSIFLGRVMKNAATVHHFQIFIKLLTFTFCTPEFVTWILMKNWDLVNLRTNANHPLQFQLIPRNDSFL